MNVTELARRLKIPTSELKELFPRLGFDIGRKAIKIDDKVAKKIIEKFKADPKLIISLRKKEEEPEEEEIIIEKGAAQEISIPATITVRDFAGLVKKQVAQIIQELMKNGILANLNEQIDYETASIMAQDFGYKTSQQQEQKESSTHDKDIEKRLTEKTAGLKPRPPVVVVMGHVDHGKTQLLDTIRKTKVMEKESGGITQHVGAYQAIKNGQLITFIDTPGHEAFTAMRSRGARVADLAILVIAADDGIKPQTQEVIKIIENAKLPFIVALNKIDKPEADVEKVKQQLAQANLLPEDWGGKIITVPISAKTGQGIDDLLEQLLLLSEVEKENIQADPDGEVIGTIVESHIDKGEGPVATVLIQSGTLKQGQAVRVGQVVGKIRMLKTSLGKIVTAANPSMPVKILGLKDVPEVGDFLLAIDDDTSLKKMKKQLQHRQKVYRDKQTWQQVQTSEDDKKNGKKSYHIILKTDVFGSREAIAQSLETLENEEVKVEIVKHGLGNITETDVLQAASAGADVFGFNVKTNSRVSEMALEKKVNISIYPVIYDLIEHVKKEVDRMKSIKIETIELGRVKTLAIFHSEKKQIIIGGLVTKGKIEKNAKVKIIRNKVEIGTGIIEKLQQAKQEVASIPSGTECGLQIKTDTVIQEGDFLDVSKEELIK
ncbi:MAG: translation initiation factor IF-2 [Patescibacteria group bacterium]|jgi:translation initiation factor IF-2